MSKNKILFKITGSIAAYKSCYIISMLVQNGYEVQTVVTPDTKYFLGNASLEGLTGKPVFVDTFEDGKMMSHINLVKWADLVVMAPATANTINKMAAGICDNLVTSLFMAHEWDTPYLVAPAMNTNMFNHPATQSSLLKLKDWGVRIIEPASGMLACGDEGVGKLADPDVIYEEIISTLNQKNVKTSNPLKVLITSGGTREDIDGVRYITNMSTGFTASQIGKYFLERGHEVIYVHALDAIIPEQQCTKYIYYSFSDLNRIVKELLEQNDFDAIIHLAAVSDYTLKSIELDGELVDAPYTGKIQSSTEEMKFVLRRNFKIVEKIKSYSRNPKLRLVSFKLVHNVEEEIKLNKVNALITNSQSDFTVMNDISDREKNIQNNFRIFDSNGELLKVDKPYDMAKELEKLLTN